MNRTDNESEDEPLLSDMEKRMAWLVEVWGDAYDDYTYDRWNDIRMMIYGALRVLSYCRDRHEDRMALTDLSWLAFQHSMTCLLEGK